MAPAVVEGENVVTIADLSHLRVESEVDEFDVARIKPGAAVTIAAEGHDKSWQGTVEEIPHAVVSRRLNPPDPSKPIDTRVLLVKIAFTEKAPLKLGQRVGSAVRVRAPIRRRSTTDDTECTEVFGPHRMSGCQRASSWPRVSGSIQMRPPPTAKNIALAAIAAPRPYVCAADPIASGAAAETRRPAL